METTFHEIAIEIKCNGWTVMYGGWLTQIKEHNSFRFMPRLITAISMLIQRSV